MIRKILLLILLIFSAVVFITTYLEPNDFANCGDTPSSDGACQKADAIIVISGGTTSVRTEFGISLYEKGWADKLIFSGAAQDKSGPSNAQSMHDQAVAAGVDDQDIILDEYAETTQQNAQRVRGIISTYDFDNIILVTSGYHQRRASLEFEKAVGESVTVRNYPVLDDGDWDSFWWLTPRGWWLAGSELVKIVAFYIGASS